MKGRKNIWAMLVKSVSSCSCTSVTFSLPILLLSMPYLNIHKTFHLYIKKVIKYFIVLEGENKNESVIPSTPINSSDFAIPLNGDARYNILGKKLKYLKT